ncbi:M14 family metallopeptidase [Paracraurococcus lichenis]|uniref:Succinylglutamate desuccinylase/aspartoacylase family protein n=1 Tax=Paracraurococcus lichenis TaxID=3064888 RepID=A0ABT9DZ17_9PROT|nr:succinylglutamate desuccinylase/aspartoacylase family protein [Paracraurococcus sp. LOR1-02]MDO9709151.1 succinylglutamate desuccinylase/aspartoacylase family protein [Paracraurococcus sp. LOR1-02]
MAEPEPLPPDLSALLAGGLPRMTVRVALPDLRPWYGGNVLPGVWSFGAEAPGPHVAVVAATHGNEIGGAILLDRWLRAGLRPQRGRLSLVFANLDALSRFDPEDPTASRFIDEDLNRVWDEETLSGGRRSSELRRARVLRPLFDTVDVLLDLHSMLWPSDPLVLTGQPRRAARLALDIGLPPLVVADEGHLAGLRIIDYARFGAPDGPGVALLLEAGAHWETATVETMEAAGARLLRHAGMLPAAEGPAPASPAMAGPPRLAEVTRTVTARTPGFAFLRPYRGGHVVPHRNTLIALDGEEEIRTPHDDCLLVMPSLRALPGQTAVRLARFVEDQVET